MRFLFIGSVFGFVFIGCSKSDNYSARQEAKKNSQWEVIFVDGIDPDSMLLPKPTIKFDVKKETCTGNSGFNTFSSNILWNWNAMAFGQITSTKNFCNDERSNHEEKLILAMQNVTRTLKDDKNLQLTDEAGKVLLILSPLK